MPDNIEIVKKLFDACMNKDFETARALVHSNYTLKDPMMTLNSADEMIEMMKNCPFDMSVKNLEVIGAGDKVVSTFESAPKDGSTKPMRMCSIVTVENGKVRSEEMFYDTAQIPQKFKDMMKQDAPAKHKSAA